MKVALFTESYKPYVSGVARSVELLKKGLESLGHRVVLFAPSYPGYEEDEQDVIRIPSVPLGYPGFRLPAPFLLKMPEAAFDVVHSNTPFGLGLYSKRLAKKLGVPFVYSFHTLFTRYLHFVPLPAAFTKPLLSAYLKNFCNSCGRIIAPNEMTAAYVRSFGVHATIDCVPSGIDFSLAEQASPEGIKERLGIHRGSKVLVFVGRLSKEKNIPFLLKAFKSICGSRKDTKLLIVAKGPLEQELKSLARGLGIDGNTVFAGQVPYPKVLDYYKCGDVFVFSSMTETQGLVIAEAKSCGLPCVAVDAAGIKDSISDGEDGFLVQESIDEFALKVLLLLDDNALHARMSSAARVNASRDFSHINIAKRIENIYNSLLNISKERCTP